jgi:hypothetical protein
MMVVIWYQEMMVILVYNSHQEAKTQLVNIKIKKRKKKLLKKIKNTKMKNITGFYNFTLEDATATMGNMNGMGNVVSAQPSSTPGSVADSTEGSGDIGATLGTYTKKATKLKEPRKKKKDKKAKPNDIVTQNDSYKHMYIIKFADYNYTKTKFK